MLARYERTQHLPLADLVYSFVFGIVLSLIVVTNELHDEGDQRRQNEFFVHSWATLISDF